jgi:exonuclease III
VRPQHNAIPNLLPKLNYSCQNVCSLNISKPNKKTYAKTAAVVRGCSDIIFLSDTRLNSDKQSSSLHDIKKKFKFLGFNFYHNSKTSSRGTAILVSTRVNCVPVGFHRDNNGNMLLVKMDFGGVTVTLGSVYGPNSDEQNFFIDLENNIRLLNSNYVVVGGDWNTTLDPRNSRLNIDTLNTAGIPSARRPLWLNTMRHNLGLADPFIHFYPEKPEFTYVPFALNATNRSRLDYFLISESLTSLCINCRIPNSLSSTLFDHKPVHLLFKRENPYKKQCINDIMLQDTDLEVTVKITVIETYINHIIPSDAISDLDILRYRVSIGQILSHQKSLFNCKLSLATNGYNREISDRCTVLRDTINNLLLNLPTVDTLETYEISCDRDVFLEILIMAIKNSSLSHQHSFFKIKNARKISLEKRLTTLKLNFNANSGEILRTERELNNVTEQDLSEEIQKMKHFEILNNEKITPYFLSLAKRPHNSESLSDLNNNDGTPFENPKQRSDYITDYYASAYRRISNVRNNTPIADFPGDVANHPSVLGSKLSNDERDDLERDLTLFEFDKAVETAKNNTAPGIDSISNRFIKVFWIYFRKPLFDCTNCCYNKGILTENFRSAKIRLIPKKGDLTVLKNWRPISLLNCFYKIISRVIAIRLRKVMDKITCVAQKGFSGTKYCQEVLTGIIDSINSINASRKPGALLSLDIKKAFDSTSHSYLQNVFAFFNFGPNFIRWLNLVGTNRRACIILENEYYSRFFDLERGNTQGDTISPYIFNIGFQILLFKLNFDLQINGLIPFPVVPVNTPPPCQLR